MVRALLVTVTLGLALAVAIIRMRGPEPQAADAPGFSAVRARAVLADLLQENRPHPVDTPENRVVRDRILARLRAHGYETSVQAAHSCNRRGKCANVENIFATAAGAQPTLVVLCAHYDSVRKGPGASDDGLGVVTLLEIASLLRGDRRIGFLITDGEEAGLLGAEAFARDAAMLGRVGVIINVENRGTSGPSLLFETSRRNANLMAVASRVLQRPVTASLFPAIYELLPNDTDLSVFKRAGKEGVNLAAIKGVQYYHTRLDDLAHVDLRTLQHHGDNALALARGYAEHPPALANQSAVFFDVFGFFVIRWPERWTIWLLLLSLAICVARFSRSTPIGVLSFFLTITAAALPALILRGVATMWILGFAAALLIAWLFRQRDLFSGVALAWHLVAIAVALALPGAAYLFAFPAFAFAIALWLPRDVRATLPALAAAVVIFPLGLMLYVALGRTGLAPTAILISLVGTTFATDLGGVSRRSGVRRP